MLLEFARTGAQTNHALIVTPGAGKEIVVYGGSFSVSADAVVTLSKDDATAETTVFKRTVLAKTQVEIHGPLPLGANVPLDLTTSAGDIYGTIRYGIRRVLTA